MTAVTATTRSIWTYGAIGACAGLLAGLFGVGGGIVLVPFLVLAGFDQHRAHATSLLAILVIAVTGALRFAAAGEVNWVVGLSVATGAVAGSTLGSRVMDRLSPQLLRGIFVAITVAAGLRMVTGGEIATGSGMVGIGAVVAGVAIGLASGFVAGVTGGGGGIVMIPAMVFLLGMDQHAAEGTSLVVIIFTALAATRVNLGTGRVDIKEGLVVGAAGMVSVLVGASLALQLDGEVLARVFGVFVLVVAARMGWSLRPARPS